MQLRLMTFAFFLSFLCFVAESEARGTSRKRCFSPPNCVVPTVRSTENSDDQPLIEADEVLQRNDEQKRDSAYYHLLKRFLDRSNKLAA